MYMYRSERREKHQQRERERGKTVELPYNGEGNKGEPDITFKIFSSNGMIALYFGKADMRVIPRSHCTSFDEREIGRG